MCSGDTARKVSLGFEVFFGDKTAFLDSGEDGVAYDLRRSVVFPEKGDRSVVSVFRWEKGAVIQLPSDVRSNGVE